MLCRLKIISPARPASLGLQRRRTSEWDKSESGRGALLTPDEKSQSNAAYRLGFSDFMVMSAVVS